jgi:hypothetical protein
VERVILQVMLKTEINKHLQYIFLMQHKFSRLSQEKIENAKAADQNTAL